MTTAPRDRIEACIDRLVADARPVRRLRSPAVRLVAWLGVVLAVAAATVVVAGLRRDVVARIASPVFLAELASLGAAATASAWIALRGAVPGLGDAPGRRIVLAMVVAGGLLCAAQAGVSATPLVDFVQRGIPCAVSFIVLVSVPWAAVIWAVGRGVPLRPGRTFAAAGFAASLAAYALMRLRCSADETLHVAVWHGGPLAMATCAAAVVGLVVARRRVARAPR